MSAQYYPCRRQSLSKADIRTYSGQSNNELAFFYGPVYPQNDGYAWKYLWNDSSMATDDDDTVLKPTAILSTDPGRWLFQELQSDHPQVCPDWNAIGNCAEILNKPAFAAVALSGAYSDLSSPPTIPASSVPSAPSSTGTQATATAFQAIDPTKQAFITLTLESTATATLLAGAQNNESTVYVGSISGIATSGGTKVGGYKNDVNNTLSLGVSTSQKAAQPISFFLPIGWYWAIRVASGTVTCTDKCENTLG